MSEASGLRWFKVLGLVGLGVVAGTKGPTLARYVSRRVRLSDLFKNAAQKVDHRVGWDHLHPVLGLPVLVGVRNTLRRDNLHEARQAPSLPTPDPVPDGDRYLTARSPDGTFNNLSCPRMGAAGTRFGRNVPIAYTHPEPEPAILSPNPRIVSRELLTRHTFQPATTLNVLAAAWLQFMISDWFAVAQVPRESLEAAAAPGRQLARKPGDLSFTRVPIRRARRIATTSPRRTSMSTRIGGTVRRSMAAQRRTREAALEVDGKLRVAPNGLIPLAPAALEQPGRGSASCCSSISSRSSTTRFAIDCALNTPGGRMTPCSTKHSSSTQRCWRRYTGGMDAGHPWASDAADRHARELVGTGRRVGFRHFGRLSTSKLMSGIVGGKTDTRCTVCGDGRVRRRLYRMHPLVPDDYALCSARNGALLRERTLQADRRQACFGRRRPVQDGRSALLLRHRSSGCDSAAQLSEISPNLRAARRPPHFHGPGFDRHSALARARRASL